MRNVPKPWHGEAKFTENFQDFGKTEKPPATILKFVGETRFLNLVYLKLCSAIHLSTKH